MPTDLRHELGKSAEDHACDEVQRRGYAILDRRYRTRFGEIDIIANDRGTLAFIEVKARTATTTCGTPADAVHGRKQARLQRLAAAYVASRRLHAMPCRFDVVTVLWPTTTETPQVDILKNAFETNSSNRW
jgi:putative endonuclease